MASSLAQSSGDVVDTGVRWPPGHAVLSARLERGLVVFLFALAVFIPGHLGGWIVERGFFLLSLAVALFLFAEARLGQRLLFGRLPASRVMVLAFVVLVIFMLATLVSEIRYASPFDLFEWVRYPTLAALLVVAGTTVDGQVRTAVAWVSRWALVYVVAVTGIMAFGIAPFAGVLDAVYDDTKTTIVFPAKVRVSIPFENPNYLALFVLTVMCYLLFAETRRSRPVFIVVGTAAMLLTGSRAGWLAMAVVIAAYTVRQLWGLVSMNRRDAARGVAALLILAIVALVAATLFTRVVGQTRRVASTVTAYRSGELADDPSLESHARLLDEAVDTFGRSPVIGWGSVQHPELEVIDNQYTAWLVRLGALGSCVLVLLLGRYVHAAATTAAAAGLRYGLLTYVLGIALMLVSGVFIDNYRLLVIIAVSVALYAPIEWHDRPVQPAHHDG